MKNEEIAVSVCMLSYNHEKYIRKAIDSVLNQKTNFKFEILIHDDASTDKSQEIIREYEKKYPDIIKPIYQTENQYSKGVKIWWQIQFPRVKGKYIAFCECDDYWTDPCKLQEQYDIMEQNKNCSVCVHNTLRIDEAAVNVLGCIPSQTPSKTIILCDEFVTMMFDLNRIAFHTTSYFIRAEYVTNIINDIPEFIIACGVSDFMLMLYCAINGDVAYIDKFMSHYRVNSLNSYTKKFNSNKEFQIKMREKFIHAIKLYNEYTNYKYDKVIQNQILFDEYMLYVLKGEYDKLKLIKYKNVYKQLPQIRKLIIKAEIISNRLKMPQLYTFLYNTYRKFESKRWETIDEFNKKNNISY